MLNLKIEITLLNTMMKTEGLKNLAMIRKEDRLPGYACVGDFHDGSYDQHDYVSPWSISAHNPEAKVMIFLQDWSSTNSLNGPFDAAAASIGYTPGLPSNRNLINLLSKHFSMTLADVYVTNLFVFIKQGGMNARIPMKDMVYCAQKYALPQIEIINPDLVICLGSSTYNALRRALGKPAISLKRGLKEPLFFKNIPIHGLSHTGGLGVANAGGLDAVETQWRTLAEAYHFRESCLI